VPPAADLIALFIAPLNRTGVQYMVTGAVAAIVYGEPRLTNDIDIVIALEPTAVHTITAAFPQSEFYVPPTEAMIAEIQRAAHGHFNIIHRETSLKADFYPVAGDPLHLWAMDHRVLIVAADQEIKVAPPEYVIIRKLQYYRDGGSDRHLRDIRSMLRVAENRIDQSFIADQVDIYGLAAQWAEASVTR
jgi:hypothetical protein